MAARRTSGTTVLLMAALLAAALALPLAGQATTAHADGERFVFVSHALDSDSWWNTIKNALKNAIIPVLTLIAAVFGYAIGGEVLVEYIFTWPGLGKYSFDAILGSDFPAVQGFIILAVAIVRLVFRLVRGVPEPEAGIPGWQETSSQIVHWLLYALLLIVPLLGWINASWRGMPVALFGYELPQLIATRAPGWQWTGDIHGLLANYVMLALVGLHVLAALYHHFVMGDGVLRRMLPGR